jgi:hypothetical protein
MPQQIASFEVLYPHLATGGVYLAEDLHTSYFAAYGGGHRKNSTFIEYSKRLIDQLNAWHSEESTLAVDGFTRSTFAMHFYDSVLVLERRDLSPPRHRMRGEPSFPLSSDERAVLERA